MSAAAAEGQIGQWVQEAARTRRGGTALATVPRFPALSLATPQRPREAERLCYASALVTRLCSAVTTPSSEGGPKRMSFGRPFKAVPAWASGLGEVSELRWGAQLWTVQLSSCASLACCLGCWFWRPWCPHLARCPVRPRGRRPEAWSGLAGVAYLLVSAPLLCPQTERSPSCFRRMRGVDGQLTAAGTRTWPRARPGGCFWSIPPRPRRPQAVLPHVSSSGFGFLLNNCEISNSFSS